MITKQGNIYPDQSGTSVASTSLRMLLQMCNIHPFSPILTPLSLPNILLAISFSRPRHSLTSITYYDFILFLKVYHLLPFPKKL